MAKFIYKMQNILEIKYKLEEQAKADYTQAKRYFDEQSELLKKLMKIKENYENELKNNMMTKLNLLKIRELENAIEVMKSKIEEQKKVVIKAYKRLNAAQKALNDLMIDRKTHEKLRDNDFEQFIKDMNLQEMKEIDELVSFRFNKT